MTTTLSEGVKVPDVGSVNWAGDLEINWNLLNGALANLSGNVKLDRDNTWTGEQSFTLPIVGSLTGTASKAIADEDGTSIKSGYVNVAGNQTVSGDKTWTGEQTFSQTIQGNAATASAFDTAKSITLTGAVTGTVSGTNSWEIATALKTGSAATGGTVTNPYFKIASWEVAPNDYFGTILQIQNKYYPYQIATLTIGLRTKTDATFQKGYSLLNNAIGIQSSAFILCYKEVTGKVLCELYYYTTTSFNGIRFSVISEGTRNDSSVFNTMVVYQNPAGIAALPSDYTAIQTSIGTYSQDFIPYATNTYSLGSSSYQWSSVYAQTYYYNGTAWGLDKANTWTGNNNFTSDFVLQNTSWSGVTPPSSAKPAIIEFKNSNTRQGRYINRVSSTSSETWIETIRNIDANTSYNFTLVSKIDNSGVKSLYPYTAGGTGADLGISTNQWSSVYAQTYYYNGTAWGLDKDNIWSGYNTYTNVLLTLKHTALEVGVLPASNQTRRYRFTDKNNTDLGWLQHRVNTSGDSYLEILSTNKFSNGQFSPQGSDVANSLIVGVHSDGKRYAQVMSDFYPVYTNFNCNLGTSTNKWNTFNGVNPGALSLPDASNSVNIDTTGWVTDGSAWNTITSSNLIDGYLYINYSQCSADDYIAVRLRTSSHQNPTFCISANTTKLGNHYLYVCVPVSKLFDVFLEIKTTGTLQKACIFPMIGNV